MILYSQPSSLCILFFLVGENPSPRSLSEKKKPSFDNTKIFDINFVTIAGADTYGMVNV